METMRLCGFFCITAQWHKSDLRDNFSTGKGAAAQEYFVYFILELVKTVKAVF
jgi:hypothetical protein